MLLQTIIYYCHARLLLNQMNGDKYEYKTNLLYSSVVVSTLFILLSYIKRVFSPSFHFLYHRITEWWKLEGVPSPFIISVALYWTLFSMSLVTGGGITGQSTPYIIFLLKSPAYVSTKPKYWCCVLWIAIVNLRLVIFLNSLLFVMFPKCS